MVLDDLYEIIKERKVNAEEGSYTKYLFNKGIDKILKKVGEECTELIIAAKGNDKDEIISEICDLTYHILVLMAEKEINLGELNNELSKRRNKINNFKTFSIASSLFLSSSGNIRFIKIYLPLPTNLI